MTTALAQRPPQQTGTAITAADELWNQEQKHALKSLLIPNGERVTDAQLALFGEVCKRTALDPFTKQIYMIPTNQGPKIHIAIDGLRAIAARTGEPISISTYWKAQGGDWEDVWEGDGEPYAALCVVKRGGGEFRAVALMKEFKGTSPTWKDKGAHQLGVVAERHALRKACPFEIAGTVRAAMSTGAVVVDSDEEPRLPPVGARPALASIGKPATTNGAANGSVSGKTGAKISGDPDNLERLRRHWNAWTDRAVRAGVEWEDLIPDLLLSSATESQLLEAGRTLRQRVEAAERAAANANAADATPAPADDEPVDAEVRTVENETPEGELTQSEESPAAWPDPPTFEEVKAQFEALSAEATALNVTHRVPGEKASQKDYADAHASLEPKVEAARAKAAKK